MRCEECGLEMVIWKSEEKDGKREAEFVCRNPACVRFDERLRKKQ